MDPAVAAAYGWADLDLGHGFHTTKQGLRYTISEAARRTVLDRLLEMTAPKLWFAVPGMYGGFHFWLDQIAGDAVLIAESWCRMVEGSGQRHLISPYGSLLIAEGFV